MANPLQNTHVMFKVDIFDVPQRVLVRKDLTVEQFTEDILKEFAQELDLNRKYVLILRNMHLDPEARITEIGVREDDVITMGYYEAVRPISEVMPAVQQTQSAQQRVAVLREVETSTTFVLEQMPAIIGRTKMSDPSSTQDLAVDLSDFREGRTVSRPHAQIVQMSGGYGVEGMKDQRPVFVNGVAVDHGKQRLLKEHDIIGVGKVELEFSTQAR